MGPWTKDFERTGRGASSESSEMIKARQLIRSSITSKNSEKAWHHWIRSPKLLEWRRSQGKDRCKPKMGAGGRRQVLLFQLESDGRWTQKWMETFDPISLLLSWKNLKQSVNSCLSTCFDMTIYNLIVFCSLYLSVIFFVKNLNPSWVFLFC